MRCKVGGGAVTNQVEDVSPSEVQDHAEKTPSASLSALYRAHAQTVARFAQRLGGPTVDVEDVVQEVFLVVHRQLSDFRGEAQVTTWLYRITENVVRHRRRKERWRRWLGGTSEEVAGRAASSRPTPVEDLERREASRIVYRVLDTMSERYRTLIILFELDGLSGEEIAELTGQRVQTVWVALHRAREQFLARLAKLEGSRT
jgi:RNA polymerase sigma-70 factor (ECF subfamily)